MDRSGERIGETFADQVNQTFDNLAAVAAEAGTSLQHMVKLGVFLSDMGNFAAFNELAAHRLEPPFPARTTVPAALQGFDIELDAVIWIPDASEKSQ